MKTFGAAFLAAAAGLALAGCGGSGGSNSSVSQAGHTAPVGMWGGALVSDATMPATLTLMTSGGQFVFTCGEAASITQEVQPDSSGHFSVAGTTNLSILPQANPTLVPTQFTGTVTNHVMTVTLTVTPAGEPAYTDGPYTVTLGQTAPTFQGACPG